MYIHTRTRIYFRLIINTGPNALPPNMQGVGVSFRLG